MGVYEQGELEASAIATFSGRVQDMIAIAR